MIRFFCYIIFSFCGLGVYSQVEISGVIYVDTTMVETIPNVKVVFKSVNMKKAIRVKSDLNGRFTFLIESPDEEYIIRIKKKGYTPINIEGFLVDEKITKLNFKLLLKKKVYFHDDNYEGSSKVISIDKL